MSLRKPKIKPIAYPMGSSQNFITKDEFSALEKRLEETKQDNQKSFAEIKSAIGDLTSSLSNAALSQSDERLNLKKGLDDMQEKISKDISDRFKTIISGIKVVAVMSISALTTIIGGAWIIFNLLYVSGDNSVRTEVISEITIMRTKLEAIEKQMDEELDWIYETKPNNERIDAIENELIEELNNIYSTMPTNDRVDALEYRLQLLE